MEYFEVHLNLWILSYDNGYALHKQPQTKVVTLREVARIFIMSF